MTTEPTPETARQLLWRHGLPEDVLEGALALHAQELAGKIRAYRDHTRGAVQATKVMEFAASLIDPAAEEPETDEQRADREETERDHAAGNHQYCGVTCEVEFPTEMLRNGILAKGYPGTAGMLDELLRRAAAEAPTTTKPETDLVEEYLWFLRGLGSEPDLSSLPPERRKVVTAQFEIIRTLADRDPELPPIERDPVARRLGLTGASEPAAGVRQDGAQPSCSAALLPFGTAPADRCVVKGKHLEHATAEGRRWTVEEPQS